MTVKNGSEKPDVCMNSRYRGRGERVTNVVGPIVVGVMLLGVTFLPSIATGQPPDSSTGAPSLSDLEQALKARQAKHSAERQRADQDAQTRADEADQRRRVAAFTQALSHVAGRWVSSVSDTKEWDHGDCKGVYQRTLTLEIESSASDAGKMHGHIANSVDFHVSMDNLPAGRTCTMRHGFTSGSCRASGVLSGESSKTDPYEEWILHAEFVNSDGQCDSESDWIAGDKKTWSLRYFDGRVLLTNPDGSQPANLSRG
jgi:hypothetical protein